MIEITSINNPIIKEIQSLKTRKGRWAKRAYLIEGFKMIGEAIMENGSILKLIMNSEVYDSQEALQLTSGMKSKADLVRVSNSLFKKLTGMDSPQGVIAIVKMKTLDIKEVAAEGRYIFLDGLQDPGNIGTIIRSADAFAFDGLIFGPGCVDPHNPKSVQASMGSILRSVLHFSQDPASDLMELKSKGYSLVSTSMAGSTELRNYEFTNKDIIVIGNEGSGVSKEISDLSDHMIAIPMSGRAESLNAGVAASLIMYEASMKSRMSVEF